MKMHWLQVTHYYWTDYTQPDMRIGAAGGGDGGGGGVIYLMY